LNLDSFFYFRSPSLNQRQNSFDSLYAHPNYFSIKEDSSVFNGHSHYLNFRIDSFENEQNGDSIFGMVFDDLNSPKQFLNDLTSSFATLNYSFLFKSDVPENDQGFEVGILIKQLDTFFIAPIGFTNINKTPSNSSLPAVLFNSLNFENVYGNNDLNVDFSGYVPYELGIYFKSNNEIERQGAITDINLNIFNAKTKDFFLFKEGTKTAISTSHCSTSGSSNYIYSNESLETIPHNFNFLNGGSSIFTNQSGHSKILTEESHGSSSLIIHSDDDSLPDSIDSDPYGKYNALFTKFSEYQFNNYLSEMSNAVKLFIEGFSYEVDLLESEILDIISLFDTFSSLINSNYLNTGVYSEVYELNNDLFLWRPKKGPQVVGYFEILVNGEAIKITVEPSIIDYST
jgi:hypothetical protein